MKPVSPTLLSSQFRASGMNWVTSNPPSLARNFYSGTLLSIRKWAPLFKMRHSIRIVSELSLGSIMTKSQLRAQDLLPRNLAMIWIWRKLLCQLTTTKLKQRPKAGSNLSYSIWIIWQEFQTSLISARNLWKSLNTLSISVTEPKYRNSPNSARSEKGLMTKMICSIKRRTQRTLSLNPRSRKLKLKSLRRTWSSP